MSATIALLGESAPLLLDAVAREMDRILYSSGREISVKIIEELP
jgi:hypothetical protein